MFIIYFYIKVCGFFSINLDTKFIIFGLCHCSLQQNVSNLCLPVKVCLFMVIEPQLDVIIDFDFY